MIIPISPCTYCHLLAGKLGPILLYMGEKEEIKERYEGRERRKEKRSKVTEKKFTGAHTGATRIVHTIPIFDSSSGGCLQRIIVEKCLKNNKTILIA